MNNTITFIIMALISGTVSGLIYAGLNFAIVEPYTDKAIELEIERLVTQGESIDMNEINSYRVWQKEGSISAAVVLGIGVASMFALVYAYARKGINGSEIKRGLIIASIFWIVLFFIPFLKYPANPPAVGDPDTIYYRQALYLTMLGISASIAVFLAYMKRNVSSKYRFVLPIIYIASIAVAFMALPSNPDEVTISMDLVNTFRTVSVIASLIAWLSLGIVFGALYERFKKRAERLA